MKSRLREGVRKARKSVVLLKRRSFVRAMLFHRVAAATEHLSIIRICEPNTLVDAGAKILTNDQTHNLFAREVGNYTL